MSDTPNDRERELLLRRISNIVKHELSGDFDLAAGNAVNSIMAYVDTYASGKVTDGRAEQIMLDFLSVSDEFGVDEGDLIEWREDSLRVLHHTHARDAA